MSETRRLLLEYEMEEVGIQARKDKRVRKALEKAFTDTSDVVRARALIAAIDLNDPTIVDNVVDVIDDEEAEVRIAAAQVLAWYKQPKTIPTMIRGLHDSNPWVRSHCAAGLSKLLHGPIWARIPREKVSVIVNNFEDMGEEEIREYLASIKLTSLGIDHFINWRDRDFNIDYDMSIVEEMESGSILLEEKEDEYRAQLEKDRAKDAEASVVKSAEVEAILDELPDDILDSLPPEDLKRLTPETARELVDSLLSSFDKEKEKKKKVKVRKVTRVRKVKKISREELIAKIPKDIKESLPAGTLDTLSEEDLEALIAASSDEDEEAAATGGSEYKSMTKSEIIDELPLHVKENYSDSKLESMKKSELVEILEDSLKEKESRTPEEEERFKDLTQKFGESKAKIMIAIPKDMLDSMPQDQLEEMDEDTLKGLAQALEHE